MRTIALVSACLLASGSARISLSLSLSFLYLFPSLFFRASYIAVDTAANNGAPNQIPHTVLRLLSCLLLLTPGH